MKKFQNFIILGLSDLAWLLLLKPGNHTARSPSFCLFCNLSSKTFRHRNLRFSIVSKRVYRCLKFLPYSDLRVYDGKLFQLSGAH